MLKGFLKGEVRLVITYWVFGVLVGMIYRAIDTSLEPQIPTLFNSAIGTIAVYAFIIFPFVYFPFVYVAIWNSANHYVGNKAWPALAKFAVLFGSILLMINAGHIIYAFWDAHNVEKNVSVEISKMNEKLPEKLNDHTELTHVSFENNIVSYDYRFMNKRLDEIDSAVFQARIRPALLRTVCGSQDIKYFLDNDLSVSFNYFDQDHKKISSVKIEPNDCE